MKFPPDHLKSIKEILLYAYIWQIPFSWRIVFDPSRSEWNGGFNEYMDISLYIGEVIIIFALITHILEYKIIEKSIFIFKKGLVNKLFHMEQYRLYLPVVILLLFINLLLSIDPALSLVTALHYFSIITFIGLFFNVYVSRGTKFVRSVLFVLVVSLALQAAIAFPQVLTEKSIGLSFLNESNLSLEMSNVAKSNLFSIPQLRAYGTFLHPNILAAYCLTILVFSIHLFRSNLFHVKHRILVLISILSTFIMLLSQSKMALIFLSLMILWYLNTKFKLFHVKQVWLLLILVLVILVFILIQVNDDAKISFQTRINQFNNQFDITVKEFFIGSGIGTYRLSYDAPSADWWNFEPVHFIPLIAFKELGVFIFIGVGIFALAVLKSVPRETWSTLFLPVILITYMSITDHFIWDIYQGSLIAALCISIIIIDKNINILHNIKNNSLKETKSGDSL